MTANATRQKGQFAKGHASTGGRPLGLMQYIRAQTQDGKRIADFMLGFMDDPRAKPALRLEAAAWLADRGFGKPVQPVDHGSDPDRPVTIALTWGEVGQ